MAPTSSAKTKARKPKKDPTRGLRRRGEIFWLRMLVRGRVRETSLGTRIYADAVAKAVAIRSDPEGWFPELPNKLEVEMEKYLAAKAAGTAGGRPHHGKTGPETKRLLLKFFSASKATYVHQILESDVLKYLSGLGQNTRVTYHARLSGFFQWLVTERQIKENPCSKCRPESPPRNVITRSQVWSREDVAQLFNAVDRPDLEFILLCGLYVVMRKGEIIACRPSWFDRKGGTITIPAEDAPFRRKNGKYSTVPLAKTFLTFIEEHPEMFEPKRAYVLHAKVHSRGYRWDFRRPLRNLLKKCNLLGSAHTMRHTFVSNALTSGKALWSVAQWIGDTVKTVETTYAKFVPSDVALDDIY